MGKWRWLKDFCYRFAPFVSARILRSDLKQIPKTIDVCKSNLENQVRETYESLENVLPHINFAKAIPMEQIHTARNALTESLGFELIRKKSLIAAGGRGIFVKSGLIRKNHLASVYPGTIYEPGDSILLQSMGNHFVLRCMDGLTVDGNDRRLSRLVHRSSNFRDLAPFVSDQTWLTETPLNFLHMGQYINNAPTNNTHNVQYIDLDITGWPKTYRKWFPYSVYNANSRYTALRIVILVAVRDISKGEELLSSYISR